MILCASVGAVLGASVGFCYGWYKGCRYMRTRLLRSFSKLTGALGIAAKTMKMQMVHISELEAMGDVERHAEGARRVN